MNRAKPVKATKVRQSHSAAPVRKPGQPTKGQNYIAQKAESTKKNARKTAAPRKATKA